MRNKIKLPEIGMEAEDEALTNESEDNQDVKNEENSFNESSETTPTEGGEDSSSGTSEDAEASMDSSDQDNGIETEDPEEERKKTREIIEERRRAEAQEREPEEVNIPDIENIDEEKKRIVNYLEPLVGQDINELFLVSAKELNRPLYHISMDPNIKQFTPQISKRTLTKENRSIPRISTSTSLIGCMNGYQSVLSDMERRQDKGFTGLYCVYELPFQYAIHPSKKVLPDVNISDEYWLFSWKKETYAITPNVVAEFTIPKIETTFGNDGSDRVYHLYIHVKANSLYLDRNHVLQEGYYHITLKGYDVDFPLEDNNKRIQINVLDELQFRQVTSLSIMIKKRPSSEYK